MMVESINTKERECLYIGPSIQVVNINIPSLLCESPYNSEPMKEKDISEDFEFEQE